MKKCNFCLMDETVPSLILNKKGECQYCSMHSQMDLEYPLNKNTNTKLLNIVKKIKIDGKNNKYDCICGISGGRDSSYMLYYVKEVLGLRPLAVHYDNGFNSKISTNNILLLLRLGCIHTNFSRLALRREILMYFLNKKILNLLHLYSPRNRIS